MKRFHFIRLELLSRGATALLLLIALAACPAGKPGGTPALVGADAQKPAVPGSATPSEAPAIGGDVNTATRAIGSMDALVAGLIVEPGLSKATLEAKLGVVLKHAADVAPDALVSEAPLSDGPFERVTLTESSPDQRPLFRVSLRVRRDIAISWDMLEARLTAPGVKTTSSGADQPNPVRIEGVPGPFGYMIKYIFREENDRLVTIAIERS